MTSSFVGGAPGVWLAVEISEGGVLTLEPPEEEALDDLAQSGLRLFSREQDSGRGPRRPVVASWRKGSGAIAEGGAKRALSPSE